MPSSILNSQASADWLCRLTIATITSVVCLALPSGNAYASRCKPLTTRPDAWVATKVDALVRAARRAYESDRALPAYERVLDEIVHTLRECNLATDNKFTNRYQAFLEYIETASLERQPDHELGLNVTDTQEWHTANLSGAWECECCRTTGGGRS